MTNIRIQLTFVTKFQLMLIIKGLAEDDEMVLVKEVASQLAKSFTEDAALLERQAALKKKTLLQFLKVLSRNTLKVHFSRDQVQKKMGSCPSWEFKSYCGVF